MLIILKKENGPRASFAPALGLMIFKYVYWYMKQISGERLQDHWSSGLEVFQKSEILKKAVSGRWCSDSSDLVLTSTKPRPLSWP